MPGRPPPAVLVQDVSKTFRIPRQQVHTLKEKALHPLRNPGHHTLHALRDLSFQVERGEFFGIVGRNGSGKSTLLKCLAGIYRADAGEIYMDGRVSTFIELGVGFNPDLAARDNVMINATMLGLSGREARRRFDAILDFAELRPFADLKLKNYSSGMLVRLAFAVMIQVDAEILLIDEVLAVGDAAFQQKCFDEFGRIRRSGATVLLVTHDMGSVERFCDRALLLEHGREAELGATQRVADRYLQLNFSTEAREHEQVPDEPAIEAGASAGEAAPGEEAGAEREEDGAVAEPEPEPLRLGDGAGEILDAWFEDAAGQRSDLMRTGDPATLRLRVRFREAVRDPIFGVSVYNSQGVYVWGANTTTLPPSGLFEAGREATVGLHFTNVFAPDRYTISPAVARRDAGNAFIDKREGFRTLVVTGTRPTYGIVDLPYEFVVDDAPVGVGGPA